MKAMLASAMRHLVFALFLVAAGEGAALACSCTAPGTPEESRALARQTLRNAVAIVEAEALSEHRPGSPGEHVRVRRVLWGSAPREFRLDRHELASGASCDLLLRRGERRRLILYPAADSRSGRRFAVQTLCADFLVASRGHLAVMLEEARDR